jgi:hypothetical protein
MRYCVLVVALVVVLAVAGALPRVSAGVSNTGLLLQPIPPGTIIVEKQTLPDGAPDMFGFFGDGSGTIDDGGQITVGALIPGTYTASEAAACGWDLTSIVCDDGNSGGDVNTRTATFVVEAGETVKCTFANTHTGLCACSLMPSGTAEDLRGVWGSAPEDVFAVGLEGTILHFGGPAYAVYLPGSNGSFQEGCGRP